MDTLLDALQEGRLFELPEADKAHALQFLAHVIEAFPEIPPDTDVVGLIMKREEAIVTALGKGWACPHARVPFEEDLKCVIGWSPSGIDYGAPDGVPVRIIVMYLVPENQRNHYLREVSMLAKAIQTYPEVKRLGEAETLNEVRNYLLDLIDATKETVGPDARARMIRLQARPSQEISLFRDLSNLLMEPVTIISGPRMGPIVLTHNPDLAEILESEATVAERIERDGVLQVSGWRVLRRSQTAYQGGKVAYECLAIKVLTNAAKR